MSIDIRSGLAISCGRLASRTSRTLGWGEGSVIAGRVAATVDPLLLQKRRSLYRRGVIFITGTNGKSTTAYYLAKLLMSLGLSAVSNWRGANLYSGILTATINRDQPVDFGIFEVDEATVPRLAQDFPPTHIIALNFSRDQLDRYGEIDRTVDVIGRKLAEQNIKLIYNAADPYAVLLSQYTANSLGYRVRSNGLWPLEKPVCRICNNGFIGVEADDNSLLFCGSCRWRADNVTLEGEQYNGIFRFGRWLIGCPSSQLAETMAAVLTLAGSLALDESRIVNALIRTPPLPIHERTVGAHDGSAVGTRLVLAKNPLSFGRQIVSGQLNQGKQILMAINRQPADGIDTSWLWDVPFERLDHQVPVAISGEVIPELSQRLRVAGRRHCTIVRPSLLGRYLREFGNDLVAIANYTAYRQLVPLVWRNREGL